MNALANSQRDELEKFLGTVPDGKAGHASPGTPARRTAEEREEILAEPARHPAHQLRDAGAAADPAAGAAALITRRREPAVPGPRRAAHLPRPAGRRRRAAGPAGARALSTSTDAPVRRHQSATLAGGGTQGRAAPRSPRWRPGSSAPTIPPDNVIGETLRRAPPTGRRPTRPVDWPRGSQRRRPTGYEELRADPLAVWIERHFGLRTERRRARLARSARRPDARSGRPPRSSPTRPAWPRRSPCEAAIQRHAAGRLRGPRPARRAARCSPSGCTSSSAGATPSTPPSSPSRTALPHHQYQRSAPGRPAGQLLFPLAFCRECGQDYSRRSTRTAAGDELQPRAISDAARSSRPTPTASSTSTDGTRGPTDEPALLDLRPRRLGR